ncbi:MAG: protein kinase, partial [Ktedonobacteraceae bacterium]|nr:protein kinase [Ktedonobacteraceae bacterium]
MVSASQFCPQCGASNQLQSRFCAQCGTSLQTATTSSPTGRLQTDYLLGQRYRVLKLLGQGGMGAVYQAEDLRFRGALRAVKEMSQNGLSPQELQETTEAFEREALILARLQHANLPRIYDHFREQGRWYLVMDYLEGETLEDRLNRLPNHPCTFAETLRISLQLCTVLDYLHTRTPPIIFRDLKPANIMLAQNDTIYLIDFGIARFFKTGQAKDTVALGSPGYAAPEQYGRAQTTPSSDIYSLGATMHHMLSGHDPSNDPFQFPDLQLDYQPGSSELTALIMQMVEMKREKRPASVAEVQQKLQTLYDQLPLNNAPSQTITISPLPVQPQRPAPPTRPPDNTNALVVDQSGAGHFYTLTEALQHASEGQPITVRPGYYHEQLVLQKNVEIVGDGPVEQIILAFTDASCIMMQTASATIHGLTIRCHEKETRQFYAIDIPTGQLCLEDCDISAEAQAGIFIHTE